MIAERQAGIGEVGRVLDRDHVEQPAVVGLAHATEQLDHAADHARLGRHARQQREAEIAHAAQPLRQRPAALRDLGIAAGRQVGGEGLVPEAAANASLGPRGRVERMAAQPFRRIDRDLSARRELDPQIAARERRRGDGRLLRQFRHVEQPLPLRAVAAVGAVVEQPDGGEAAAPPVGPLDRQLVASMRNPGNARILAAPIVGGAGACGCFRGRHRATFYRHFVTLRQSLGTVDLDREHDPDASHGGSG